MSIPAEGLAQLASIVCPHQYLEVGHFCLPVLLVDNFTWPNWNASKQRTSNICLPTNVFDSVLVNVKMLNKGCLKNLVVKHQQSRTGYLMSDLKEQKHEFYPSVICLVTTFHLMYFKLTQP